MPNTKKSEKILRKMTFGFEIEGAFSDKLYQQTMMLGDWHGDGSVNVNVNGDEFGRNTFPIDEQEFSSNVFKDYKKMLEVMAMFTKKNHAYNSTCGLHVHVGFRLKLMRQQLQKVMTNLPAILKIQQQAQKIMCECLKFRLKHHARYCTPYPRNIDLRAEAMYHSKYRFMRYHPTGTLEFRFLTPCQHKLDNTQKLLTMIGDFLATPEQHDYQIAVEYDNAPENIEHIINAEIEPLNINIKIPKETDETFNF